MIKGVLAAIAGVLILFGVTYQTPLEALKDIPPTIKHIIEPLGGVRFDRAHFQSYGEFALMFEVVYYVLDSDYNRYMDIQQVINLALCAAFQEKNIEFAYPTRTLYITGQSDNSQPPKRQAHGLGGSPH